MTVAFLLLVRFGSLCMIIRFKTAFELAILTIVVYLDGVINNSVPEPPSTKTRYRGVFKIHVKYGHVGIRSLR